MRFGVLIPLVNSGIILTVISIWYYFNGTILALPSVDIRIHESAVSALYSNLSCCFASGLFYYGFYFLSVLTMHLSGFNALSSIEASSVFLFIISPLVIYLSVKEITTQWTGIIASSLFAFSLAIWYNTIFGYAFYPNLFGILSCFFLLYSFAKIQKRDYRVLWFLPLVLFCFIYGHFSNLAFLPGLYISLFMIIQNWRKRFYLFSPLVLLPIAFIYGKAINFLGLNTHFPFLGASSALGLLIGTGPYTITLIIFAIIGARRASKNKWIVGIMAWLIVLLAIAPNNTPGYTYRYSLELFFPLLILGAVGLREVFLLLLKSQKPISTQVQHIASI